MRKVTFEQVQDAESALENLRGDYLRSHGWKYSCINPASLWLWSKTHEAARSTACPWT